MPSLELRVPPVPLAGVFAAAMFGLSRLARAATLVLPGRAGLALGFLFLGLAIGLAGVVAFRAHATTVNPLDPGASSALVSSGVYRFSRNPMYLGLLLALVGWAAYLSNALAILLLPAFVAYLTRFQIKPEERILLSKFGEPFSRYMAAVRRWV